MLETTALITARDAKKRGLFSEPARLESVDVGFSIHVATNGRDTMIFHLPKSNVSKDFAVDDPRFWTATSVRFAVSKLGFGDRHYFFCPKDSKRCSQLLIINGVLISKRAAKKHWRELGICRNQVDAIVAASLVLDQSGVTWLSAERRALLTRQAEAFRHTDPRIAEKVAKMGAQKKRDELIRFWESRPYSTTNAFECGASLFDTAAFNRMVERPADWFAGVPSLPECERPSVPAFITEFPELDIAILIERKILLTALAIGRNLYSKTGLADGRYLSMFILPDDPFFPQLIFEIEPQGGEPYWQKIEFGRQLGATRPQHFVCPVTRLKARKLYFRSGYFASRQAQFLKFPEDGKEAYIERQIMLSRQNLS